MIGLMQEREYDRMEHKSIVLITSPRYLIRLGFFDNRCSTAATFPAPDEDSRSSPYVHMNKNSGVRMRLQYEL